MRHIVGATGWGRASPPPLQRLTPSSVGAPPLTTLVAGHRHVCGTEGDGSVWCWGANYAGQFGDGTTDGSSTPTRAAGNLRFVQLAAGAVHTCGLTAAGAAWCWGRNSSGEIGDGTSDRRLSPVQVLGGFIFTRMAAGGGTCGLTTTTAAYCWGLGSLVPSVVTLPPP